MNQAQDFEPEDHCPVWNQSQCWFIVTSVCKVSYATYKPKIPYCSYELMWTKVIPKRTSVTQHDERDKLKFGTHQDFI